MNKYIGLFVLIRVRVRVVEGGVEGVRWGEGEGVRVG